MLISVIVPVRDRAQPLGETLVGLRQQTLPASAYEIIIVDDGSIPPIALPTSKSGPSCNLLRTSGRERSAARNAGAGAAGGDVLVFVDDDISVGPAFLEAHLLGQREWPGAMVVGSIRLPEEALARPFGRFRQALELQGIPRDRGITGAKNFCTAANMSMRRGRFVELGGFDEALVAAEDQDLALRHSQKGGMIVFLPEAAAIHRDGALDARTYCRRSEWGSERLVAFSERHRDWPDSIERDRVNGPVRWRQEAVVWTVRKVVKKAVASRAVVEVLFAMAVILERSAPDSWVLRRVYRLLLGAHVFRGHRRGLARAERVSGVKGSMMAADRG